MIKRLPFVLSCLWLLASPVAAGNWVWFDRFVDRFMSLPAFGVPMLSYAPETNLAIGAAAQGYFRCTDQSETSMIQLTGAYTLNRQWYLHSHGTVYFGTKQLWQISYNAAYRYYPDLYFDAGNAFSLKSPQSYLSRRGVLAVTALCEVGQHWSAGPQAHYLYESTDIRPLTHMLGIGGKVQYDSRDTHYYPHSGLYFAFSTIYYESLNQYFERMGNIHTDLRQYIPLYKDMLFAWQFRTDWTIGGNKPFQLQPALGGEDVVRGVRFGMFRGDALWALQGELRFPIFWLFSGTVFAGMGDVYQYADWQWQIPKVGYGIGLRLKINAANINVRLDLARNNLNSVWNKWEGYSLYLTLTEAF